MKIDRSKAAPIRITYNDYRGRASIRTITPVVLEFGSTEWHPEPQWLLLAYDNDRRAHCVLALRSCNFTIHDEGGSRGGRCGVDGDAEAPWR